MCRFVLYKGPRLTLASLITEPAHSLINQSTHSRESEEPLNGDGFGIAWYSPQISLEPAVFRSITPAWNNMNLLNLARVTEAETVLAHVRAATRGQPVTELNCHPFAHGPYAFMHNGDVGGFHRLRRALLSELSEPAFTAIAGSTDSEHLFALFLDEISRAPRGDRGDTLAAALAAAVRRLLALQRKLAIEDHNYLNVAVTDGHAAAALRFTTDKAENAASLYIHTGRRYECDGGVCRMIEPEAGKGAVIVSSEPLSADGGWQMIPPNHIVVIGEDRTADIRPAAA